MDNKYIIFLVKIKLNNFINCDKIRLSYMDQYEYHTHIFFIKKIIAIHSFSLYVPN